jgi:transcription elongation factor Elf1
LQEEKEVVRDSKQDSLMECPKCGNDKSFNFYNDKNNAAIICNKCNYIENVEFEIF